MLGEQVVIVDQLEAKVILDQLDLWDLEGTWVSLDQLVKMENLADWDLLDPQDLLDPLVSLHMHHSSLVH